MAALAQPDQITGGRLLLSFVTGLNQPGEREALSLAGASRGVEIEEVLGLLRLWWAGERSITTLTDGCTPVLCPLPGQFRIHWRFGSAAAAQKRLIESARSLMAGSARNSPRPKRRSPVSASKVSADRASREVDPEHFGMSIAYARTLPDPEVLGALTARRADTDPLALVPVGEKGLRSFINAYIEAGLSKFVVRPAAGVASWADEAEWLGNAILDLQT